jgi:hypothetical protein
MAITIEYDTAREPSGLKVRRSVALPLYALALILSFLSDGFANLAALIAGDPH